MDDEAIAIPAIKQRLALDICERKKALPPDAEEAEDTSRGRREGLKRHKARAIPFQYQGVADVVGVAKEVFFIDIEEFPVVAPLSFEHLNLDEARAIPFVNAGLSRVPGLDVPQRHTLCQGKKGAASDLKEMPLLGGEARERLKRFPCRAGSFVKDLLDIVIERPMTGTYPGGDKELAGFELEEQHVFATGERQHAVIHELPAFPAERRCTDVAVTAIHVRRR